MKYTPKTPPKNVNVSRTSPLKDLFVLLCGLLTILIFLYLILGVGVDLIVPRLPLEAEEALGIPFQKIYADSEENAASRRLQRILQELLEEMPDARMSYEVALVKSDLFNAMALPGGQIVVYSALMDEIESDNELAFVLAHELGHFSGRDHLRGLGRGLLLYGMLALIMGSDHITTDFIGQFLVGVQMQHSQKQEMMADRYALDLLNRRYQTVPGAVAFMKKISARVGGGPFLRYFSTHPDPDVRLSAIKREIKNKGYLTYTKVP